jgi:5'-nucleotidase
MAGTALALTAGAMRLLLCNDDGLHAEGLQILRHELAIALPDATLVTVAPDREQSAASHALTLSDPLRIERFDDEQYAVSGTPTDCVLIAVHGLLGRRPDLVLSGINHGPNMGEDVHYSGTVAAAFEGMVLGIPSIALSLASKDVPRDFSGARHFVREVLPAWLRHGLRGRMLLNVNIPAAAPGDIAGIRLCKLGSREYRDVVVRKEDPRGKEYYWIGGSVRHAPLENTDFVLNEQGYVTVTPLHVDVTDYDRMGELRPLEADWPTG